MPGWPEYWRTTFCPARSPTDNARSMSGAILLGGSQISSQTRLRLGFEVPGMRHLTPGGICKTFQPISSPRMTPMSAPGLLAEGGIAIIDPDDLNGRRMIGGGREPRWPDTASGRFGQALCILPEDVVLNGLREARIRLDGADSDSCELFCQLIYEVAGIGFRTDLGSQDEYRDMDS